MTQVHLLLQHSHIQLLFTEGLVMRPSLPFHHQLIPTPVTSACQCLFQHPLFLTPITVSISDSSVCFGFCKLMCSEVEIHPKLTDNPLKMAWCLKVHVYLSSWCTNTALTSHSAALYWCIIPTFQGCINPVGSAWCMNAALATHYSSGLHHADKRA